ncbi:MAG: hypothetical protein ACFFCT_13785 [Candidatus Odinarchaeota archaeon]
MRRKRSALLEQQPGIFSCDTASSPCHTTTTNSPAAMSYASTAYELLWTRGYT